MSYKLYNTLTVSLTNKCNAKCDFCFFGCDSIKEEAIDVPSICNTINETKNLKNIRCIALTGGEAFLYYDKILEIVKCANECDKISVIYTNGFWCSSYELVYERLSELIKYRLHTILISLDAYHQKYVDISKIKTLLQVCQELNLFVKIHSAVTYSSLKETDNIICSLGLDKIGASITQSSVMPIGRAIECIGTEDFICNKSLTTMHCSYDNMCHVNWNGDVYACCSGGQSDKFILGNIYEDDIITILNRAGKNEYFKVMLSKGMKWFIETITDNDLGHLSPYYTDPCQLCHEIFTDDNLCEKLLPYMEK